MTHDLKIYNGGRDARRNILDRRDSSEGQAASFRFGCLILKYDAISMRGVVNILGCLGKPRRKALQIVCQIQCVKVRNNLSAIEKFR